MMPDDISVSTVGLQGARFDLMRFDTVEKSLVAVTVAIESTSEPRVRVGDAAEVRIQIPDAIRILRGVVESRRWTPGRLDGTGVLVLHVRVHKRFRRPKRAAATAKSRAPSIEDFLPCPLRPSDRAFLRRHRRQQRHLARYAVATGWSAEGAAWLSKLATNEAVDRLAVAERRAPIEIMESLVRFSPKPTRRARRRP